MTINQLLYFTAIVEHKNFLSAAKSLNLSQSSLSKSIQRLEEELEVKLFDRSKRSAMLTEQGQVFFTGAQTILTAYRESMCILNRTRSRNQNTLRLVTLPILSQYNITRKIRSFSDSHPDIALIIDEMEDHALIKELKEGTCDAAIMRKESIFNNKYTCYPLAQDELAAVLPLTHPLASQSSISLKDLENEKFILMNHHISIYQLCIDACRENGFIPHVIRTARIESILSAVEAEEGVSLLMRKNIAIFNHSNLAVRPLKECVTSTVAAILPDKKKPNQNVQRLLALLTTN